MYKWLWVLAVLLVVVGVACSAQQWQIKAALDADEQVLFTLCTPNVRSCAMAAEGAMVPGSGDRQPRVGQYCRTLANGDLYCGRGFALIRLFPVTPAGE